MRLNRILDDSARVELEEVIEYIANTDLELTKRKVPRANVQQAFTYKVIDTICDQSTALRILCGGSYEDTAFETLKAEEYPAEKLIGIDPTYGTTIETYKSDELFDIVFSTSVIEHVVEDFNFIEKLAEFVAKDGYLIVTCDFKREYIVGDSNCPTTSFRFYTPLRLQQIVDLLTPMGFVLADEPTWDEGEQDFEWEGHHYAFATLVAKRVN